MKKEYYIQGNPARAEEIKAAFEKLGYKTIVYCFNAERTLYFTAGGAIKTATYEPYKSIIKTHPDYMELPLPVEPNFKVGDWIITDKNHVWLVDEDCSTTGYLYRLIAPHGKVEVGEYEAVDAHSRLWAIQDAKDGDVLVLNGKPFIYSHNKYGKNYCYIDDCGQFRVNFSLVFEGNCVCPATKQERDLLFTKMLEVGYEWDAAKKELRKIKPHYDISNFKPKQWVLVRDCDNQLWGLSIFSHRDMGCFICINRNDFRQCIPLEGNEKLLGTTDMPSEEYINWR